MAAKDTQLADHPRGLRSRCELLAISGQVARNAPAPMRVLVFAMCVHAACTVRMRYSSPISLVWQAWSATSSTSDQDAGG